MVSTKQQRFIDEYLVDLNGRQAAMRAGYSVKTAKYIACRMLRQPEVQAALAEGRARQAERLGITADRAVSELARVALSDVRRLFNAQGRLLPVSALDDATAAAIASVKLTARAPRGRAGEEAVEVDHVVEIRLWDKNAALEKLGKHLGLFRERLDVTVNGDLAEKIAAARQRVVASQERK